MEQELHQPMEVPPGFHLHPTDDEQICGSQDGGQLHPALLPLQQTESQLPVCNSAASRSMAALAAVKSSLSKRKATDRNALKPPTRKRRKSPGSHVQIMRSPQLKRIMLSPRMGPHASKRLRSPSMRGTGLSSDDTAMSSSSASPNDTAMDTSHSLVPGRVVCDYRSRLTSKNIEALVCLQDWLRVEGHADFKITEDTSDGED